MLKLFKEAQEKYPEFDTFVQENHITFPAIAECMRDGWELEGEISIEQVAAALFMEANTADSDVKAGNAHELWPHTLRYMAFECLKIAGHEKEKVFHYRKD